MAEFIMKEVAGDRDWQIVSRATSSWEHGNPIHHGTQGIFKQYDISHDRKKTIQQISRQELADFDVIIGMDENNVRGFEEAISRIKFLMTRFTSFVRGRA